MGILNLELIVMTVQMIVKLVMILAPVSTEEVSVGMVTLVEKKVLTAVAVIVVSVEIVVLVLSTLLQEIEIFCVHIFWWHLLLTHSCNRFF